MDAYQYDYRCKVYAGNVVDVYGLCKFHTFRSNYLEHGQLRYVMDQRRTYTISLELFLDYWDVYQKNIHSDYREHT